MASPFSNLFQNTVVSCLNKKGLDVEKNRELAAKETVVKADVFVTGKECDAVLMLEIHRGFPQADVLDMLYWLENRLGKKPVVFAQFFSPYYDSQKKAMKMAEFLGKKTLPGYLALRLKKWVFKDFESSYNSCDRKVAEQKAEKLAEVFASKL